MKSDDKGTCDGKYDYIEYEIAGVELKTKCHKRLPETVWVGSGVCFDCDLKITLDQEMKFVICRKKIAKIRKTSDYKRETKADKLVKYGCFLCPFNDECNLEDYCIFDEDKNKDLGEHEEQKLKVYCIIINDRHIDPAVFPFTNAEEAIDIARKKAKYYCRHEEFYEEFDNGNGHDWIFYAQYSVEGDFVMVVEREVDKDF